MGEMEKSLIFGALVFATIILGHRLAYRKWYEFHSYTCSVERIGRRQGASDRDALLVGVAAICNKKAEKPRPRTPAILYPLFVVLVIICLVYASALSK